MPLRSKLLALRAATIEEFMILPMFCENTLSGYRIVSLVLTKCVKLVSFRINDDVHATNAPVGLHD